MNLLGLIDKFTAKKGERPHRRDHVRSWILLQARGVSSSNGLMQMKLFHGGDRQGVERRINEWLKENNINTLKFVAQSESDGNVVITIWW